MIASGHADGSRFMGLDLAAGLQDAVQCFFSTAEFVIGRAFVRPDGRAGTYSSTASRTMDPGSAAHHFVLRSVRGTFPSRVPGCGAAPFGQLLSSVPGSSSKGGHDGPASACQAVAHQLPPKSQLKNPTSRKTTRSHLIAEFCRQSDMAESTFGRQAVNDGKLVHRLREGKRITIDTLDRIQAHRRVDAGRGCRRRGG